MDTSLAEQRWRTRFVIWLILSAFVTCDVLYGEGWQLTLVMVVYALISLHLALQCEGTWRRESWSGFNYVNSLGASLCWAALVGLVVLIGFLIFDSPAAALPVAIAGIALFCLGALLALWDSW